MVKTIEFIGTLGSRILFFEDQTVPYGNIPIVRFIHILEHLILAPLIEPWHLYDGDVIPQIRKILLVPIIPMDECIHIHCTKERCLVLVIGFYIEFLVDIHHIGYGEGNVILFDILRDHHDTVHTDATTHTWEELWGSLASSVLGAVIDHSCSSFSK